MVDKSRFRKVEVDRRGVYMAFDIEQMDVAE